MKKLLSLIPSIALRANPRNLPLPVTEWALALPALILLIAG